MGKKYFGGWNGSNNPEQAKPRGEINDAEIPSISEIRRTQEMYGGPVDGASGGGEQVLENIDKAAKAYAEQNSRNTSWKDRALDD